MNTKNQIDSHNDDYVNKEANREYIITSNEIREKFLQFFERKLHTRIDSVSLVPENDSTLLFVNSGMFPLVPFLLGEKDHPQGQRLVNVQRCFRSDDIEEVGDHRHTTCFEMLGNRSLGDYFKNEQLNYWYEFLIEELNLNPEKIYQSVFAGNDKVAPDNESIAILKSIYERYGINCEVGEPTLGKGDLGNGKDIDFGKDRIFPYRDKNRWQRGEAVGEVGGPDTETFYDTGKEHDLKYGQHCHINCDCGRFIEIGNSVFIQYVLTEEGWKQIEKKNVDFGGGLERLTTVANGFSNVFETDLFKPYINHIEVKYGISYQENHRSLEIMADHLRASILLIMDGCLPSNKDQGYFLRRLVRKILVQLYKLNLDVDVLGDLIKLFIRDLGNVYPKMNESSGLIIDTIVQESNKFNKVLEKGIVYLDKISSKEYLSGEEIFKIQATYGLPYEIIKELSELKGIKIDEEGYFKKLEEHKKISKKGSDIKFKSGLADQSDKTVRYHTITHLLHAALKKILGENVSQKGSNLNAERLRFDFSYAEKISEDKLREIESEVNNAIHRKFIVDKQEMSLSEAKDSGAIGLFEDKYGSNVTVYSIMSVDGDVISKELCAGPHIENSDNLGEFKIIKEESVGNGIRRIKAKLIDTLS